VWLSGGIDSSTILHYASKASSSRLKTFSISFLGRSFDETNYIQQVVAQYGTEHEQLDLNPELDLQGARQNLAVTLRDLSIVAFIFFGFPLLQKIVEKAPSLYEPADDSSRIVPEYSVAEARANEGKYQEAVDEYRKVIAEYPDDIYPHLRIAELALNRRHLLAQQHFTTASVEGRFRLSTDGLGHSHDFDAMRQYPRNQVQTGANFDSFENFLLLLGRRVHVTGDHVRKLARRLLGLDGRDHFGRRLRQELQGLQRLPFQKDETRFNFGCALSEPRLHNRSNPGDEKWAPFQELDNLESLYALGHEMVRSVESRDVSRNIGDRADAAHLGS